MTNAQIADALDEIADLLEFQGANAFRVRAYRNGARTIRHYSSSVSDIVARADLQLIAIDGIGKELAAKIEMLVSTGDLPILNELRREVPESVLALLRIPGLGPKKATILFKELDITSLADLRTACEAEQVRGLKGFGAKTEKLIIDGIGFAESTASANRLYWSDADEIAQRLLKHMRIRPEIERLEIAGSYRRGKETVGDLDLLVVAANGELVMDHFSLFPEIGETLVRGDTKMSARLRNGLQVDLRVVPQRAFGAALQYFTGSKEHNVVVRGLARKQGLKVNEWGVFRPSGRGEEEFLAGETEADVYAALSLPNFPPELREARQEFDWAGQGMLPELVTLQDIQGDLHMHTVATDGIGTIEEMVMAAKALGLTYIAITDHSQRVSMANGLDAERLLAQWDAIDAVRATLGDEFKVLKGIECDILERGGMDLGDEILAQADWVMASIHYGQRQSRDQITGRIVDAIQNPYVSAIAHPTGRLLNKRSAYDVDMAAVMSAAAEHGKWLELNAHPARLDLDDIHCRMAKDFGIPVVISTDAHSVVGLQDMRHGVRQARRAGLTKCDVANTRSWLELTELRR